MSRRILAPIVVALAALPAFAGTASADNIAAGPSKEKCRQHVRSVLADPESPYTRADWSIVNAFSGHNHYRRCTIKYDTAATASTKRYACTETIDVYLLPHDADRNRRIFTDHITRACWNELVGPRPH